MHAFSLCLSLPHASILHCSLHQLALFRNDFVLVGLTFEFERISILWSHWQCIKGYIIIKLLWIRYFRIKPTKAKWILSNNRVRTEQEKYSNARTSNSWTHLHSIIKLFYGFFCSNFCLFFFQIVYFFSPCCCKCGVVFESGTDVQIVCLFYFCIFFSSSCWWVRIKYVLRLTLEEIKPNWNI